MGFLDPIASLISGRDHKYTPLPVSGSGVSQSPTGGSGRSPRGDFKRAALKFAMGAAATVLLGYLVLSAFLSVSLSAYHSTSL